MTKSNYTTDIGLVAGWKNQNAFNNTESPILKPRQPHKFQISFLFFLAADSAGYKETYIKKPPFGVALLCLQIKQNKAISKKSCSRLLY